MTLEELKKVQKADRERLRSFKEGLDRCDRIAEELSMKKKSEPKQMKRAKNLSVTQEMLGNVRGELLSRLSELEHRMNKRFSEADVKMEKLLELMSATKAESSRCLAMHEELLNNNRAVFDGWNNLNQRMERIELNWTKKFGAEA